ncbi:MAG: helix-turn-helix transcriptional regulator [Sporolactobacillus sp.]
MRTIFQPNVSDIKLSDLFYALSDPIRLEIVSKLAAGGEQSCKTLGIPGANSTLSHHYKVLREAGVTNTHLVGNQRCISLRRADLDARFPGLLDVVLSGIEASEKE